MKQLILTLITVVSGTAFAQVNPLTSAYNFNLESQRLHQVVVTSPVAPQVQPYTVQLVRQSDLFYRCVAGNSAIGACHQPLAAAQQTFAAVEGYLWNTQTSLPSVYYQYTRTKTALNQVIAIQAGPAGGMLHVSGTMNRIQYYFQGRNQMTIVNQCLAWGRQYHVAMVSQLIANGYLVNLGPVSVSIDKACQAAAQRAIP